MGMDIDQYVKYIQSGEGKAQIDLAEHTGAIDDSNEDERLITTNTVQ